MELDTEYFFALAEALGIGLLIGIEREQQAHRSGKEASAGVRTFTLASLVGALSMMAGGVPLLSVSVVIVGVFRVVWIVVQGDKSARLTTSLALVAVVLLGAIAVETATMAAGVAVLIASLMAAREVLHNFSRTVLTAVELRDGLILGASVLVILPVLPNLDLGPGGALNPRNLFIIAVLIMSIGAAGHIATRVVGARMGLPLSGFLSGFVSSTATIGALGRRAGDKPDDARSASAGAALSSVSSLIQIGIILFALSPAMFAAGIPILFMTVLAAALYGAAIFFLSLHGETKPAVLELPSQVFSVTGAIKFMLIVASVMLISAILSERFGSGAVLPAVALAGLVSTNSAAVALASLVAAGQMPAIEGTLPLAAALSANTAVRLWISLRASEPSYRLAVSGSLVAQLAALWAAWWLGGSILTWFAT
jgi:uncharacterized membrane protein (DUF4010 family)